MKIEKDVVVSIVYQVMLKDDNTIIDETNHEAPLDYLYGHNNLIAGLERELLGKQVGDKFTTTVEPQDAYGEYDDNLVQRVKASLFQGTDEIEIGMRFLADTDQGQIPVEITEIDGDEVVVDGNHMLAGHTLVFNVEIVGIRAATEQEIAHGHIHSDDSDDHDCQ